MFAPSKSQSKYRSYLASDFLEYSKMSVISTISKFIESINEMNDIVLVPSRLMDIETKSKESFDDLHSIHSILNQLKDELTFGRLEGDYNNNSNSNNNNYNNYNSNNTLMNNNNSNIGRQTTSHKEKSPESDDGFSSLNSFSQSCTEDESSDSDSEFGKSEIKDIRDDYTSPQCLINLFRLHLQGMQTTLSRFTEYAYHISECYKKQID